MILPILLLMMQSAVPAQTKTADQCYINSDHTWQFRMNAESFGHRAECEANAAARAKPPAHRHKPTGCYAGKYGWTYDHNEGGWPDRKSCEGYRKNPVGLTGDPNPSEREMTVISNPCNPTVEPIYTTHISECIPKRDDPHHGTWREIPGPSEGVEINKEYTQSDVYMDGHHYLATCPYSRYYPEEGCDLKLIPDNPTNDVIEKRISDLEKKVQELEFRSDADSLVCVNCISSPSTDPELQHKPNAAGRITYGGAEEFTVYRGMCGDQECVELYRSGNPGICGEGCKECKEIFIPFPDGSVLMKK